VESSKEHAIEREILDDTDSIKDEADENLYIAQRGTQRPRY
jgi:hypothetical protein